MLRYLVALIALVCLSDVASACHARRTPVRTVLSALRPANHGGVFVHRERHVVRERGGFLGRLIAPAPKCGPFGCPVPVPVKK